MWICQGSRWGMCKRRLTFVGKGVGGLWRGRMGLLMWVQTRDCSQMQVGYWPYLCEARQASERGLLNGSSQYSCAAAIPKALKQNRQNSCVRSGGTTAPHSTNARWPRQPSAGHQSLLPDGKWAAKASKGFGAGLSIGCKLSICCMAPVTADSFAACKMN